MDLKEYLPGLLMAAGAALQWLRQYQRFQEPLYHVIAVILSTFSYALVTPLGEGGVRVWTLDCIQWLSVGGGLATIWGGTFIASNAAKGGVAVVSMTKSKS